MLAHSNSCPNHLPILLGVSVFRVSLVGRFNFLLSSSAASSTYESRVIPRAGTRSTSPVNPPAVGSGHGAISGRRIGYNLTGRADQVRLNGLVGSGVPPGRHTAGRFKKYRPVPPRCPPPQRGRGAAVTPWKRSRRDAAEELPRTACAVVSRSARARHALPSRRGDLAAGPPRGRRSCRRGGVLRRMPRR